MIELICGGTVLALFAAPVIDHLFIAKGGFRWMHTDGS